MNLIDDILNEYVRMREYGLSVREALKALKIYVEELDHDTRELLAQHLRAIEAERDSYPNMPHSKIKKIQPIIPHPTTSDLLWVECHNCHSKNRAKEVFCYHCGILLIEKRGLGDTKQFMQASDDVYQDEYFSPESILVLRGKNTRFELDIRPQKYDREMIIGRGSKISASPWLDIDFTKMKGTQLGVSRMHLALAFNELEHIIQIRDLDSSNGSFINGLRIHPSERRTLRHDDELRLGRLVLGITYLHPGKPI